MMIIPRFIALQYGLFAIFADPHRVYCVGDRIGARSLESALPAALYGAVRDGGIG